MRNSVAALAVLILLAACDGNPLTVPTTTTPPTTPTTPPTGPEVNANGIPTALARNLEGIAYDPVAKTLMVTIAGIDGTPEAVSYTRNMAAEVGLPAGYEAYSIQEDPLDRFFTGVVRESADGSVTAAIASDGGQFNRFFSGGWYERDGSFTPPNIGNGPGEGQVTYAGGYVGLDNYSGPLPPTPPGTNPAVQPQAPGRIAGDVIINANFSDMLVNGSINNRVRLDNPGLDATSPLANLVLVVTGISAEGEFLGDVELQGLIGQSIGQYGGLFGGLDASSLAAVLFIEEFDSTLEGEAETGLLVLTQCGMAGSDPALCTGTAP